jgi:peptidoglycan-N-acetylglucosamine deacetylase
MLNSVLECVNLKYICLMSVFQKTPHWLKSLFPSLVWEIPNQGQTVYLTFDDGPHPHITPWVLEQLNRFQFKGTFFCVGDNVVKYPEIVALIQRDGHALGNHTMNHVKGWQMKNADYLDNVSSCHQVLKSTLFRPPYGRIKWSQVKLLKPNYKVVMWSLLSLDYLKGLNVEKSLNELKKQTKSGSIIVFHDSVKAEQNLKDLLPPYLQFLNDNGFNCQVIS